MNSHGLRVVVAASAAAAVALAGGVFAVGSLRSGGSVGAMTADGPVDSEAVVRPLVSGSPQHPVPSASPSGARAGNPSATGYIFITRAELNSKPTSGRGWDLLKSKADLHSYGVVDLGDQNSFTQSHVLAGALVYARTGIMSYRSKVISAVKQTCGTEADGPSNLLGLARTLYGYVVAADLVRMPQSTKCTNGQTWRSFLGGIRTQAISGHGRWQTLEFTSANTASNWGAYALSTHLAVSYALNDQAAIARDTKIFKRYLGDTTSTAQPFVPTAGYRYNSNGVTWDMSPTMLRGINPYSASDRRSGAIIEDSLRSPSSDSARCCIVQSAGITYQEEAMDGMLSSAQLLRAHGVDLRTFQQNAMKRAYHFFITNGGPGPYTTSRYIPYAINYLYRSQYPVLTEGRPDRHLGYGTWLFTGFA